MQLHNSLSCRQVSSTAQKTPVLWISCLNRKTAQQGRQPWRTSLLCMLSQKMPPLVGFRWTQRAEQPHDKPSPKAQGRCAYTTLLIRCRVFVAPVLLHRGECSLLPEHLCQTQSTQQARCSACCNNTEVWCPAGQHREGFEVLTCSLWCLHFAYPVVVLFPCHLRPAAQLASAPASSCRPKHHRSEGLRIVKCIQQGRQFCPAATVVMLLHRDCVMLALWQPTLQERQNVGKPWALSLRDCQQQPPLGC